MPFAFLAGLLRTHLSLLDAELRASLEELRASRARIVEAGDAERRRLERDLHDGAQSRLVALKLLLSSARLRARRASGDVDAMLSEAIDELDTSLSELRELARGIHPAVLTDHGLEPALQALASRAPVPVTVEAEAEERLPGTGGERRLLRRLRGAGQRRQVRPGHRGRGRGAPHGRARDGRRHRRRDRRRRRRARLGPARSGRPASPRSTARCRWRARSGGGTHLHAEIPCLPPA